MNKHTFTHGKFYKITRFGKINLNFIGGNGRKPITISGDGEPVWFVGLAWKKGYIFRSNSNSDEKPRMPLYLIASNFYEGTNMLYVEYDENTLYKRDKVKCMEPFPLKSFPTLIGTKTTTLFSRLLQNKISGKGFPNRGII